MKNWMLLLGIAGLGLGWGFFGAQQVKKREYQCQVRVEFLCFMWEKSDYGKAQDPTGDELHKRLKE